MRWSEEYSHPLVALSLKLYSYNHYVSHPLLREATEEEEEEKVAEEQEEVNQPTCLRSLVHHNSALWWLGCLFAMMS